MGVRGKGPAFEASCPAQQCRGQAASAASPTGFAQFGRFIKPNGRKIVRLAHARPLVNSVFLVPQVQVYNWFRLAPGTTFTESRPFDMSDPSSACLLWHNEMKCRGL